MRKRDLFLNPRTRGKWLDMHFKTSPPTMQSFAIDGTGRIFREPDDVKKVYLADGTLFLRKKLEAPGPEEEAKRTFPEPPDLKNRPLQVKQKKHNHRTRERHAPNGGIKCTIAQPKTFLITRGRTS